MAKQWSSHICFYISYVLNVNILKKYGHYTYNYRNYVFKLNVWRIWLIWQFLLNISWQLLLKIGVYIYIYIYREAFSFYTCLLQIETSTQSHSFSFLPNIDCHSTLDSMKQKKYIRKLFPSIRVCLLQIETPTQSHSL